MADNANYQPVPAMEISPGVTLFGIPIIPATPGSTNSDFPSLPSLPDIPGSIINGIGDAINPFVSGSLTNSAASSVASIFGFPFERLITVIVGIIIIFVGFHMLGNATIADAISSLKKAA